MFGGRNRRWYECYTELWILMVLSETTASNVWDIQLWVMVPGGKGKAGGLSGFEFFCFWANDFPVLTLSISPISCGHNDTHHMPCRFSPEYLKCNHMSTNLFPMYTCNVGYQLICGAFIQSTYVQNANMYLVLFQAPETQKKLNTTFLSLKRPTLPG